MYQQTDPWPYIYAAYLLGALLIFGYVYYIRRERRLLSSFLPSSKETKKEGS